MRKIAVAIVLVVLLSASAVVLAQDQPGVTIGPADMGYLKWDTFGSGDDEFHARFPKAPSVFLTRRDLGDVAGPHTGRIYAASEEGVVCIVVVFDNPKKVSPLDEFIAELQNRFFSSWEMKFDHLITLNTDDGKHYLIKAGSSVGAAQFFVKPKHSYMFAAVADRADHPGVKRFMDFITMWNYSLDKLQESHKRAREAGGVTATNAGLGPASEPSPKNKDEEEILPGIKPIKKAGSSVAPSGSHSPTGSQETSPNNPAGYYDQIFEPDQVTTGAAVVLKPDALYTEEAHNNRIEGSVKLSATLTPDGKIKDVSVIEGLPYGLSENAINALRHLVFLPARKDDHYVAQKLTIDYTFTLR